MSRTMLIRACFTLFAALLFSIPASATVRSTSAKIRWVGELPTAARPGQDFTGQFEVVAAKPGVLENVRVEGAGWSVQPMAAARATLARGQRRAFTFTARPSRGSDPLVVIATFDGKEIRETIRLDEASLARAARRPVAFKEGPPRVASPVRRQGGVESNSARTTTLHITGRFTYLRGGGAPVEIGADHIRVKIWDEDDISDELIWQGETDLNGNFDVTVEWDDCDISGCDDPDIYVEFLTVGDVVNVHSDPVFQFPYAWYTEVMDDFTGNSIAYGTMYPDDPADYAACSVFNGIVRAARFAELYGMTPPVVSCIWPGDGTNYNRDLQEINIEPGYEWHEGAQSHEFGHHLHYIYGNMPESDYENGYCDTPEPSHCLWCPENDQDAFKEGWANWFASIVNRSYQGTYGITPTSIYDPRMTLDTLGVCTDHGTPETWPGPYTEGYIGAILRDMDDIENDDHDGGAADCHMDVMTIGADEIMTVFRDDDPTDIWQFLSAFRTRYGEHDQDLWSVLMNVWPGFAFTLEAPIVTSGSPSCLLVRAADPVTLSVQGNGSLLKYQWRRDGVPLTDNPPAMTGTTTKMLSFGAGLDMSGSYDCVVSTCDLSLSTNSEPTRVTVLEIAGPKYLVSWGENLYYQAGDGTNTWRIPPYVHTTHPNMIQTEGGRAHSIGLDATGQVHTWGLNDAGQLGIGAFFPSFVAAPAPNLMNNTIQVAAGHAFSMALTEVGTLSAWGYNNRGQLGINSFLTQATPIPTVDMGGCVIAVSCGEAHTIALRDDGTVVGWGGNDYGTLGRGFEDTQRYPTPAPVVGLTDVVAISASGYSNLALKSDGTVWAWGSNTVGQLGIGPSTPGVPTPVQVNGLPAIRAITAGHSAGFAIGTNGSAWSWGSDFGGQLGTGASIGGRNTPGPMALTNPHQIVSGEGGWGAARMGNRTVRVWGYNVEQINGTSTPVQIFTPMEVSGVVRVNAIGAGTGTLHAMGDLDGVTSTPGDELPLVLALTASPNPSLGRTRLAFDLPRAGHVTLAIYDLAGRRVRLLVDGLHEPGRYDAAWDGRAEAGGAHAAGVYFARIHLGGETRTQRIVRIR